ncbi:MAG TPA: HAMP domain-containing sensor histidine kinase [Stellaceae bacterium]|nr:HAMP domain-containing sensor histidine kinase [Stellaceae bacterium]
MLRKLHIDHPRFPAGSPQAYLVAAAIVAVATIVRIMLNPWLPGLPYFPLFPGMVLATFLCGSAAGLLAFVLSVAAAWLFVFPPELAYLPLYQTLMFAGGSLTIVIVVGAMRAATADVRRLNETLRLSEARLAEASRAKSDFLASVSHELRTPLNAIIGFSEMIRDAVIGPLDARYRGYGSDINESGRHLQNIINDILDISKIEGGRLELREETVSIGETLRSCRRIVEGMAISAEVSLAIEVSSALPLIRADQLRFQQILLNLMSNAVKFTPAGGRVRVSAAIETEDVVIAVEDTGIGMKEADIALALEPFRQIEGPHSRRFAGTGLGLPLAKALVELHGGRLDIRSAPAAGTTVLVRLPSDRLLVAAA